MREEVEESREPKREENECFKYKLVGVNVHSGNGEAGHYYSLINTNRSDKAPTDLDE